MKEENNFFQVAGKNQVHAFNKNKKIQTNWRKLKMSIKKKLAMGIATGALAVSMIGGGTYAYFNDVEFTNNTFAAGTLDLRVDPEVIINVANLKPGDKMLRTFKLINDGTLDIKNVLIHTEYGQTGGGNEDFGKHIRVNYLRNIDKGSLLDPTNVVESKTLQELKAMQLEPDAVKRLYSNIFAKLYGEASGLKAGNNNNVDNLYVQFEFVDDGNDQNVLQNASLQLEWKFEATQMDGNPLK